MLKRHVHVNSTSQITSRDKTHNIIYVLGGEGSNTTRVKVMFQHEMFYFREKEEMHR